MPKFMTMIFLNFDLERKEYIKLRFNFPKGALSHNFFFQKKKKGN